MTVDVDTLSARHWASVPAAAPLPLHLHELIHGHHVVVKMRHDLAYPSSNWLNNCCQHRRQQNHRMQVSEQTQNAPGEPSFAPGRKIF